MVKKRKLSKSMYSTAYQDKDKGGKAKETYIDWNKITKEEKIRFYSPREGANKINVIPFEIKSKNHPLVKAGRAEVGDLDFVLDIWVHRFIGPNHADVLCPKKTYGKHCPICEEAAKFYDQGKTEEHQKLKPTRRVLLNVQPIVKGEVQDLHVFEVSHYLFMKELIEEANECGNGEDIIPFADIENGKIIKFRVSKEPFGKNQKSEFKSFAFLERDEELDEELIDDAISFDDGLKLLSYEELENVLFGQDEDEEEEDVPKKAKKKKVEEEEDDDDIDEEEVERSTKKRRKVEEDEEDDEEEEAPKKAKKRDTDNECPSGFVFGKDEGKHKECNKCPKWEECVDAGA